MLRFQHRRAGLSLMEALVALFIMAIGMISLLTLFPLGAIQMGRALRDDRCAQCAWQADGVVRTWWQVEVVDRPGTETGPYFPQLNTTATTGPGKVVAIDPIGIDSGNATAINGVPRTTSRMLQGQPIGTILRSCSLTDDLFFDDRAIPDNQSTVGVNAKTGLKNIARQGRYNWMAWIQRPVNDNKHVANLKVLVFDGRVPGVNQSTSGGERVITLGPGNDTVIGLTQVKIPILLSNAGFPPIGKGGWIIDTGGDGSRMDFYRVQSLTEDTANGVTFLELDTPWKNSTTSIVILRGLAEVFDRPVLAPTAYLNPQP